MKRLILALTIAASPAFSGGDDPVSKPVNPCKGEC